MANCFRNRLPLLAALAALVALAVPLHGAAKKPAAKPAPKTTIQPAGKPAVPEANPENPDKLPLGPDKLPLAPGDLPIFARSAVVLDSKTGDFLFEKNADALEYPASTTKILTALLVIEAGDLDKIVTVELADTKVEPSSLDLKVGETYPRKHLLYALLLKSANDVAMALARDNAGSIEAFAEKMTKRAAALGAVNSNFRNPHGLHDPHHFTTAHDLARIARAAMENPLFREIVSTPDAWMVKGDSWVYFRNHNRLLTRFEGCTGLKTGFTRPAQQVLVSSAMKDGHEVISVVLHTNKPGIWDDSALLLRHGFEKLGLIPPSAPLTPAIPPTAPGAKSDADPDGE
jgi:D-alanyl-D-alanine carboxypeptidase (penicillin-binding protein 5/6)